MKRLLLFFALFIFLKAGAQPDIKAGEYFIGAIDPGNGMGVPFQAADGNWNEVVEAIIANAQTLTINNSPILINIRLKDNNNNWGPLFKKTLFFEAGVMNTHSEKITNGEYFIGAIDPGNGMGVPFQAADGNWNEVVEQIIANAQTLTINNSPILINIRLKDDYNNWGPLYKKTLFFEAGAMNTHTEKITYAEYFFGIFDPGEGMGVPILATDGSFNEVVESVLRTNATWAVSIGPTLFNIRLRDAYNHWGPLFRKTIFPYGANTTTNLILEGDSVHVCPNTALTLHYAGPNGYTPTWFNNSNDTTITFTPATSGYYTVQASLANDSYIDSIYVDIMQTPQPTVTPTGTIMVCANSSISLQTPNTPNTTWQWYFNGIAIPGALNFTYIPTQTGVYAVAATSTLSNCTAISANTTLTTTASFTAVGNNVNCSGSAILIAVQGTGNAYQWRLNGTPIPGATNDSLVVTNSGNYSVSITSGPCTYTSPQQAITLQNGPLIPTISASGPTTFCQGSQVTLTTATQVNCTYQWYLNGSIINGATSNQVNANQSGWYKIAVTNVSNCTVSDSINITVNPKPSITVAANPNTICSGAIVN